MEKTKRVSLPWQLLQQFSFMLASITECHKLYWQVGKMMNRMIPCQNAYVFYEHGKYTRIGFSNEPGAIQDTIVRSTPGSLIDWVKTNRKPVYDASNLKAVRVPKGAFMIAPILHPEYPATANILGIIYLRSPKKSSNFTLEEHILFEWMAKEISQAFYNRILYERATRDFLTGTYIRGYFLDRIQRRIQNVPHHPISILLIDIDYFKKINDTYGHAIGDVLLQKLCRLMESHLQNEDILCRYGGEEFAILLENVNYNSAFYLAEKIRADVANHIFIIAKHRIKITISIGVSDYHYPEVYENFILNADFALYQAKDNGRNKVY